MSSDCSCQDDDASGKAARPPICGLGEVYAQQGTDCATCKNYMVVRCALQHIPKCYCISGNVRNDKGVCIPTDKCSKCKSGEVFKTEGIDCQTCANYQFVRCALIKESRCYCMDNNVRDVTNGVCVPISSCPAKSA